MPEILPVPLPISQAAIQTAQQFAQQQPIPVKAAQVYRNTLAVWVMNDYLQMLGVPTQLTASDSWNCVLRLCGDVADLQLLEIGKLECRPLLPGDHYCWVPPETWEDRIGYVAIGLDEVNAAANFLGFLPAVAHSEVALSLWRSPTDLFDHLAQLHPASTTAAPRMITLGRWFQGEIAAGWQSVASLLRSHQQTFAFRGNATLAAELAEATEFTIEQAKFITFPNHDSIALVMKLALDQQNVTHVLLRVYPLGASPYLTPGLALIVLDESGDVFLAVEATALNDYVQLQFSGTEGELFQIRVVIGADRYQEQFMI